MLKRIEAKNYFTITPMFTFLLKASKCCLVGGQSGYCFREIVLEQHVVTVQGQLCKKGALSVGVCMFIWELERPGPLTCTRLLH